MKILIADDERDLCDAVCKIVERHDHTCVAVCDGADVLDAYRAECPDLVILDVMMPDVNGFDLCRELRQLDVKLPIIMLSAKSDIVDKSIGFAAGCDDYIAKPFNGQELLLRLEAGLRRARVAESGASKRRSRAVVRLADMEIRLKKNEVLVHGQYVNLTPKEFQIIAFLANHVGEVFTAQSIIENVWGATYMPESASIAVFVHKIRSKIEDDPSKPRYLQTVWREGYRLGDENMLEPPEDEPAAG